MYKECVHLEQGSANDDRGPNLDSTIQSVLLMAAFMLSQQNGRVVTETVWPAKLKIFIICPFVEQSLPSLILDLT